MDEVTIPTETVRFVEQLRDAASACLADDLADIAHYMRNGDKPEYTGPIAAVVLDHDCTVRIAELRALAGYVGLYSDESRHDEELVSESDVRECMYGYITQRLIELKASIGTDTPWSTDLHGYTPVDITPAELRPEGLDRSVAEGWAEPYATPDDVPDWGARHAAALVRYSFDGRGWPLNPAGRTGRMGRNLGRWGENAAADPIVVAGRGADRQVLLIKRADQGLWAIPGGMIDPGEMAPAPLVRELLEETGVDLTAMTPRILARTYVDDWRNTDHAWVCSVVALYQLPARYAATAGDDAVAAAWWPFGDLDELTEALAVVYAQLYETHRPLLAAALDELEGLS